MEDDIQIIERKPVNVKGALLVEGFPSVGMVSSIVANYMVKTLNMEYIGSINSRFFSPTAVILNSVPMPPVRIYAGQPIEKKDCICDMLVVITSEFPPPLELMKPLVDKILAWTAEKEIDLVISVEGIINETTGTNPPNTYAIASTENARKLLENKNITPLKNGVITGISGIMLHVAEQRQRDVICLLSDANPRIPDARSAARLIEILDKFLPKIKLDPQPLIEEAERLEAQLKQSILQSKTIGTRPQVGDTTSVMFG